MEIKTVCHSDVSIQERDRNNKVYLPWETWQSSMRWVYTECQLIEWCWVRCKQEMSCLLSVATEDAHYVHGEDTEDSREDGIAALWLSPAQTELICLSSHQLRVKQYSQDNNNSGVLSLWRWSVGFCAFLAWAQLGPVERHWWPRGLANCSPPSTTTTLFHSWTEFSHPSSWRPSSWCTVVVVWLLNITTPPLPTFPNFARHLYAQTMWVKLDLKPWENN